MVQHVGKRRFEAQMQALPDSDYLRQTRTDCNSAGCLKAADSCIPNSPCIQRRRCKRVEVEIVAPRTVSWNWIADSIRTNDRTVCFRIRVGLVIGHAVGRGQIRPCLQA